MPGVEAGDTKEALLGLWGDCCYICGGPLGSMHVEHVKPRSAGGGDTLANLRPACAACNLAKGAKPLAEYLAYRKQKGEPVDASAHRAGLRPTAGQMYIPPPAALPRPGGGDDEPQNNRLNRTFRRLASGAQRAAASIPRRFRRK